MKISLLFLLCGCLLATIVTGPISINPVSPDQSHGYVLTSFEADYTSNPNGVLRVFYSPNALNWSWFTKPVTYNCFQGVRDPSIINWQGTYYMIHTLTGTNPSCVPQTYMIGLSTSTDRVTWSNMQLIDLTTHGDASAVFSWAPEWFVDPNGSGLSSVHVFLSISNTASCCSNFQIYEMHPTSNNFSTWSNITSIPITGEGNSIDPMVVYKSSTNTYYCWFKAQSTGYLNYASSSTLIGTYAPVKTDTNWANIGQAEGPFVVQISGTHWRWYYDLCTNTYSAGQINYTDSFDNWLTWQAPGVPITTPTQAKQGSFIAF